MDLIERYIQEVRRHLPKKLRRDVGRELRSSLEDACDTPGEIDEDRVVGLLSEYGPPKQMALSYASGPRHLIGPAFYDNFLTTMKICLSVLAGLHLLGFVASFSHAGLTMGGLLKDVVLLWQDFFNTSLGVLGLVVLIFVVCDRVAGSEGLKPAEWDPRDLPALKETDTDRIDRGSEVVGVVILGLLLALLTLWPEKVGFFTTFGSESRFVPVLGPGFETVRPLLSLYLVGMAVQGLFLLRRGRWNVALRWSDFVLTMVLAAFWLHLRSAEGVFEIKALSASSPGSSAEDLQLLVEEVGPVVRTIFDFVCLGAVVWYGWCSVRKFITAVRRGL